ncbi:putative glycosyl transferase [Clostridium homopropionicum DSM 5847]|uniref:Putative glycosyl transferase n=1 Tax=Clostridium homopropionicum DSM 5847 TaxID=1121318 RepID=A0A0L6ZCN1_9CLOT|nr:hypothetical protein [Clostridium homopropionicum]KOA20578.1 putative glycosyl transferase [Clostridium homopropionicum DSM 5847]SFF93983.1 hypothetical protein SAMN04488501_103283 [Clostridium homopropionicum]
MKILFIIGFYMSNHSYRENYYAKLLEEYGHQVKVITSDIYYPFSNLTKQRRLNLVREEVSDKFVERREHKFLLKDMVYFSFKDVFDTFRPDIVHLMEGRQLISYFASEEAKKKNIPVIYEHEQRTDFGSFLGVIRNKIINRHLIKNTARNSTGIRTVSRESLEYLSNIISTDNKIVEVATLGYNDKIFKMNNSCRNKVRNELSVKADEFLIITSGKFLGNKKLNLLVKSFLSAKANNSKMRMIIVGEINEDISIYLDNSDIIIIPQLVNENRLNELFNAADLAIWTRYTISYFQSLGTGCPILVPNFKYTQQLRDKIYDSQGVNLFEIQFNQDEYLFKMDERDIVKNISKEISSIYKGNLNRRVISCESKIFAWSQVVKNLEKQYLNVINKFNNLK